MPSIEPQLVAPPTKSHVSVARLHKHWYVAMRSKDLKKGGVKKTTILGIPMVLFRGNDGKAGALLDRCPHRNVPLSLGRVAGGSLQCCYHGWEFEPNGRCSKIPGLVGEYDRKGREATAYPLVEEQGFVWVYPDRDSEPVASPYQVPHMDDPRYTSACRYTDAKASLHATIENALDVPHTAFLHRGLFRGTGKKNDIRAVVRRWPDRCEAEYIGEPRPEGLAGKLLAPGGGEVQHFDRFFLPSIAQVDYTLGDDTHICVTSLCTPVSDFYTRLHAVVSFRIPVVPGWIIKAALEPLGRLIFSQDAKILDQQTKTIQRFGGEQYASTEIDLLGPQIWRLMRSAERGESTARSDADPVEKEVMLHV